MRKFSSAGPPHAEQAHVPDWPERFARYGARVLVASVTLALLGSLVYAATWQKQPEPVSAQEDACPDPPCGVSLEELGGAPVLLIIPNLGYVSAIVLGVPSVLASLVAAVRRRTSPRLGRRLLVFFGPLFVFVGIEIVPHVINPCIAAGTAMSAVCDGSDINDQWHALQHTGVGAVPLTGLYLWLLRKSSGPATDVGVARTR